MKMIQVDSVLGSKEQTSTSKGWIVSLTTHILFLALLCLPFIVTKIPVPEPEGLLVNLGLQDQGQGEETPKGETKELSASPAPAAPQPEVKPVAAKSPAKETV